MLKHARVLAGAIAIVALISSAAMAGTLALNNGPTSLAPGLKVSQEYIQGGATTANKVGIGAVINTYTPALLGNLPTGNSVNITVDKGKITNTLATPANLLLCNAANATVGAYASSINSGTGLQFLLSAPLVNATVYHLGSGACATSPVAGDITVDVPSTASNMTVTVSAFNATLGANVDTTPATTILSAAPELTASVNTKAAAKITPTNGFKSFTTSSSTPLLTDTIKVDLVKNATLDVTGSSTFPDTYKLILDLGDATGVTTVAGTTTAGTLTSPFTCAVDASSSKLWNCTSATTAALATGTSTSTLTITVNGTTVLPARNFKVSAEYTFKTASLAHTVAGGNALLNGVDAGAWVIDAKQAFIPALSTNAAQATTCSVSNSGSSSVDVTLNVLSSQSGVPISTGLALGSIPARTTKALVFSGFTAQLGSKTPASLSALGTGTLAYTGQLMVTGSPTDVFVTCSQVDALGNNRTINVLRDLSIATGFAN